MSDVIADDLIEGVPAIADFLGWEGEPGKRRVRHMRERATGCPIRKRPGVGIYAFKSELLAWLKGEETLPQRDAA